MSDLPVNVVERALLSRLAGGGTLIGLLGGTVLYNQLAPEGAGFPHLVFGLASGVDDHDTSHRARQLMYQVTGVSKIGIAEAGSIDAAADALLHMSPLSVSGWTNFWLARESDVRLVEFDTTERVTYYRSGGMYRLRIAV